MSDGSSYYWGSSSSAGYNVFRTSAAIPAQIFCCRVSVVKKYPKASRPVRTRHAPLSERKRMFAGAAWPARILVLPK